MRTLNIAAALSGLLALGFLVAASHPLRDALAPADLERIELAAIAAACSILSPAR